MSAPSNVVDDENNVVEDEIVKQSKVTNKWLDLPQEYEKVDAQYTVK